MSSQIPPGTDLNTIPAGVPPPGETSNLTDPPSLAPATLGVSITLMVIGTAFAASSVWDHRRRLRTTDYMIILAVFFSISYTVLVFSYDSIDTHTWDVSVASAINPTLIKKEFAQNILIAPATFFAKAAIMFLYLFVFGIEKKLRWAVYIALVIDLCAYLPQFAVGPALCAPAAGQPWDANVSLKCAKSTIWGIVQSCLGLILDLMLFIMPIPIVIRLQLSPKKRFAVLLVFGTAILGIVASIVSLVYRTYLLDSSDKLWYSAVVQLCVLVEMWIAIIVAGTPGFASTFKLLVMESGLMSSVRNSFTSLRRLGRSTNASGESRRQSLPESSRNANRARMGSSSTDMELQDVKTYREHREVPEDRIGKTVSIRQEDEAQT